MNWIIFFLIFASLLCRPNVKKETSNNRNLHKLKENFMIALGLSLLFGMGWAVGLLASSDLPRAVRYPAEWIFTLATAFLGVYLFVLYVLRAQEARKFWKKWCLCQHKRKIAKTSINTPSRTRRGTVSSTLRRWGGSLRPNILRRASKDTSAINSTISHNPPSTSTNPHSLSSPSGGKVHVNSSYAEPSSVMENSTAGVTSSYLPPVEFEMVHILDPNRQSNAKEASETVSLSELPVKLDIDTESFVETISFHDNFSLTNFDAFSSQSGQSLSGTDADCHIVENKETEGPDFIPL